MKLTVSSILIFCALSITLSGCDKLSLFNNNSKIIGVWDAKTISSDGNIVSLPTPITENDFELNISKIDKDNVKVELIVIVGTNRGSSETFEVPVTKSGSDFKLKLNDNAEAVISGENLTLTLTDGADVTEITFVKVK